MNVHDGPLWFVSAIGVAVLAIVWRVVCFSVDEFLRKRLHKRRVGNRSEDDIKLGDQTVWVDRLIESMSKNAEINQAFAKNISLILERQEAILEATRNVQSQYRENRTVMDRVLKVISHIEEKLVSA